MTLGLEPGRDGLEGGGAGERESDGAGSGSSRWPWTRQVPAGRGRSRTPCPRRLADLEDGEAVLVEFGRRQALGVVLGSAREVPDHDETDRGAGAGGWAAPAAADAGAGALGRRALPRTAGAGHPGDAAARVAGAAGTRRGADADARPPPTDDLDTADADLLDQLGVGAATGPGAGRTRWTGGPAASPARPRGTRPRDARLDAAGRGRRPALRTLDPPGAGGPGGRRGPRQR